MELNEILQIIQDGKLDEQSRDWLIGAEAILRANGKKAEAKQIKSALKAKPDNNQAHAAATDQPQITAEQFDKNIDAITAFSQTYDINNDPELKKQIENMTMTTDDKETPLTDENGQPATVAQEIVDTAKLIVQDQNVENEKEIASVDEYNEKVNEQIQKLIESMKATDKTLLNSDIDTSKKYNIHALSVGATLSAHIETVKAHAQELSAKYKDSKANYAERVREQVGSLDVKLTKKLGKWYTAPRDTVRAMIKNGTWKEAVAGGVLGGVSMFATGAVLSGVAAAGLAVYSGWIAYRRTAPFIKQMFADKKAAKEAGQTFSYKQYYKEHKNDARKAALYAAAGVAGIVGGLAAGYTAYLSTADAAAQSAAAVSSTWLRSATGMTRMGATWGATNVANLSVALDFKGRTAEERKQAWKHIGASTAIMGGIMAGGAMLSGFTHDANAAETGDAPAGATGTGEGKPYTDTIFDEDGNLIDKPVVEDVDQIPLKPGEHLPDQGNVDGTEGGDVADGTSDVVTQYAVEPAGDRELAYYTEKMKLVPGYEKIIENINTGVVKIPDGMSPAEAINIGRIQFQNYGNYSVLEALKGCGGDDLRETLYNLHNNSWTKFDGVHKLGDIKGFVGDPCRYSTMYQKGDDPCNLGLKVKDICNQTTVYNNDHVVTQEPAAQEPAAQQAPETKPAMRPLDKMPDHYNSPNEMITPDPAKANIRVDVVPQNNAGHPGHYNNEQEFYQDQSGSRPVKSTSGKTFTVKGSYVRD